MATTAESPSAKRTLDVLNLLLGIWIMVTPFVFGMAEYATGLWTMLALGAAIVIVSLWAMSELDNKVSEWVNIVLGALLFISPWVMGFAAFLPSAWMAWICGAAIIIIAAVDLPMTHPYPKAA